MMPRVSVVMPSYNHAPFVRKAVESVLTQSFADLELLVNDDASTDGTPDVVSTIRDSRLTLHVFDTNNGASASVNNALERAQGEYIAILNSDDFFLPGKLDLQVRYLDENPSVGAVFGLPHFVDENDAPLAPELNPMRDLFVRTNMSRRQWLHRFFRIGNALCHPTVLVRRSCYEELGKYDARLAQLPDFDLWIRIAMHHELHIIDQKLTAFRLLSGERNASGGSTIGKVRHDFELQYVLQRYSELDDDELRAIFPDEFGWLGANTGKTNPRILLGLLALDIGKSAWARSSYVAYGLKLLYEEVGKLGSEMSNAEFMRLSGTNDAFNLNADRDGQAARVELENIRKSRSWRLTAPLRNIKFLRKPTFAN